LLGFVYSCIPTERASLAMAAYKIRMRFGTAMQESHAITLPDPALLSVPLFWPLLATQKIAHDGLDLFVHHGDQSAVQGKPLLQRRVFRPWAQTEHEEHRLPDLSARRRKRRHHCEGANAEKHIGTPKDKIASLIAPGGHIGLFMGSKTLKETWPQIAR
jgi:hypothetical protein